MLRQVSPQLPAEAGGGPDLALIQPLQHLPEDVFGIVQVGLHLQGVVDAVVTLLEQQPVRDFLRILVMHPAQGLDKAVGDQGSGGDDHLQPAPVDHLADEQAHLGHAHGPGEGAHHGAVGVPQHGLQDVGRLPQTAAAEGGPPHGPEELIEILNGVKVQGRQGRQAVLGPIMQILKFPAH